MGASDRPVAAGPKLPADIGLPSQLYAAMQLGAALELLASRTRLVEIDSFGLHTMLSRSNRRAACESGLAFTVHGPYGYDFDPGNVNESGRRAVVEEHRRHAEAAGDIGALCYVVHPDRRVEAGPRNPGVLTALLRTFSDLEEAQRDCGVRIAIENMPGRGLSHFTGPGDIELGDLGLALDCGHAAISGTLEAFLADPGAELVHVHLHSNAGACEPDDPHRPLGEGIVDAAPVLELARRAGATMILEHDDEESVKASIAHLEARGLLEQREDGAFR